MYTTKLLSSSIGDNLASFEGIASNGVFENESVLTVFQRSSRMFGIFGRPVPGLSYASEVETISEDFDDIWKYPKKVRLSSA